MTDQVVTIEEAVRKFIADRPDFEAAEQAELRRFERWLGKTKRFGDLKPLDIEHYSEKFSPSDPECKHKLEVARKFLAYARDKGWTTTNLGLHLKARKGRIKGSGVTRGVRPELAVLTRQGYDDLIKELDELAIQRPKVLEEIRRAAADKDFRENAPLQAAREQLGHIDGRIQELTATVRSASIIDEHGVAGDTMAVGDAISLKEITSGQKLEYVIVGPKEADPTHGKISHVSPIGKAVIGKSLGDIIEVISPAGSRRYQIEGIKKR